MYPCADKSAFLRAGWLSVAALMLLLAAPSLAASAAATEQTATAPASGPATSQAASTQSAGAEPSIATPLPPEPLPSGANDTHTSGALWQMFASILVILAFGAAAILIIKKVLPKLGPIAAKGGISSRGGHLRVIETVRLGPQRQVHLLEVDGRRYLVGHTANNITLLAEVPGDGVSGQKEGS
jgi:flagellar biogenesis protein FliO